MSPAAAPRRRLRPEQRRELVLDAGLEVFAARGYHAAALSDIAARAGTTKPVLFDRFGSKRALYDAVVARELRLLVDATLAAPEAGDQDARLTALLDAWFAHVAARPAAQRLLFEVADDPSSGASGGHTLANQAIEGLLRDGGSFAGDPHRLALAAQMVKTAMNGAAVWWLAQSGVPRHDVVAGTARFLAGGLRALDEGLAVQEAVPRGVERERD